MKNSRQTIEARRNKILAIVRKTGDIRVKDVARHLHISEITVRRDMQFLEDKHYVERYYGGARVVTEKKAPSKEYITVCRENIARFAAGLVEDGDTIFINTSSTALMMIPFIKAKNVTVITNNGNAVNMPKGHRVRVLLTGGELYNIKGTMVGDFALENLARVTAKKAFVGCSGLSMQNGMTTEILEEVNLNRAMVQRVVGKTYILADHTKLGKNSSFVSVPVDAIENVITDAGAPASVIEAMKRSGLNVDVVPTSPMEDDE